MSRGFAKSFVEAVGPQVRADLRACNPAPGDCLRWVEPVSGCEHWFLVTKARAVDRGGRGFLNAALEEWAAQLAGMPPCTFNAPRLSAKRDGLDWDITKVTLSERLPAHVNLVIYCGDEAEVPGAAQPAARPARDVAASSAAVDRGWQRAGPVGVPLWSAPGAAVDTPAWLVFSLQEELALAELRAAFASEAHRVPITHRRDAGTGRSVTVGWLPDGTPLPLNERFPRTLAALEPLRQKLSPGGGYARVQLNLNYEAGWHRDVLNVGSSTLIVWGDYVSGGELETENGVYDVRGRALVFDGLTAHRVCAYAPATAQRYAIVLFRKASDCGEVPDEVDDDDLEALLPRGRDRTMHDLIRMGAREPRTDLSHAKVKPVADTTIRPETVLLAEATHEACTYLSNSYWAGQREMLERTGAPGWQTEAEQPPVRLTDAQFQQLLDANLYTAMEPRANEGWFELTPAWLVPDKRPELARFILHPVGTNDWADPPVTRPFPTAYHVVRDTLGAGVRRARTVDAKSYYFQFEAPRELSNTLRVWRDGVCYRFRRLPMGLKHAVAAGQAFFLWCAGVPDEHDWRVAGHPPIYIDGGVFVDERRYAEFAERINRARVVIGDDSGWTNEFEFIGCHVVLGDAGWWALRDRTRDKVAEPLELTLAGVLRKIGRILAALRLLALPWGLAPAMYRYAATLMVGAWWTRLRQPIAVPQGVQHELECVTRVIVAARRVWRPIPRTRAHVATDATIDGMGAVVIVAGTVFMFAMEWPTRVNSMPIAEMTAGQNGALLTMHVAGCEVAIQGYVDCIPAMRWLDRRLARAPNANARLAAGQEVAESAGAVAFYEHLGTSIHPADAPSRVWAPDERTWGWAPSDTSAETLLQRNDFACGQAAFANSEEMRGLMAACRGGVPERFVREPGPVPRMFLDPTSAATRRLLPRTGRLICWRHGCAEHVVRLLWSGETAPTRTQPASY